MTQAVSKKPVGSTRRMILACCGMILFAVINSYGQLAEVTLRAEFAPNDRAHKTPTATYPVVAWLTPLDVDSSKIPPLEKQTYQMVQKDKMFSPHLLVMPVGSVVVFPNLDPFFHNVFSLFNGKRFDLGLYETGSERRVRFDRDGVSYIFCNIHPEMGAVILTLSTPYYGVSRDDVITIPRVVPGKYRLNLWSEDATSQSLNAARREVTIPAGATNLGSVSLVAAPSPVAHHANKFGEPYSAASSSSVPGTTY